MKNTNKFKGPILLLICAIFWGTAFVAQALGSNYVGAYTYNALRFLVAGTILILITLVRKKTQKDKIRLINTESKSLKYILLFSILVGVALFLGATFQQLGITLTKSSLKSGFISTIYIVLVPLVALIFGKKLKPLMIPLMFVALLGSFLIALNEEFKLETGDILTLICALFFAFQIVFIDHITPHIDSILLTAIEFIVAGIISIIIAFIVEPINIDNLLKALPSILYAAIFSGCISYTLQIEGQKYTPPTLASMIMSLESVFAMFSGIIFLNEKLTINVLIGSILIFAAIILAQLDITFKKKKENNI